MIDWWALLRNSLWILGLAGGVASWSYARWWAIERGLRFRQVVGEPLFIIPFSAAMALFSLGMAFCSRHWWETAIWAALTVLLLMRGVYSWLGSRQGGRQVDRSGSEEMQ